MVAKEKRTPQQHKKGMKCTTPLPYLLSPSILKERFHYIVDFLHFILFYYRSRHLYYFSSMLCYRSLLLVCFICIQIFFPVVVF